MKELYELKEKLCRELKDLSRGELSMSSLDKIDKLAHACKNIDKIIESEGQYSGAYRSYARDGMSQRGAGSYATDGYYNPDGTYSTTDPSYRGRGRDSMGRYSSEGYSSSHGMKEELQKLMMNSSDERTRSEIQRIMTMM